MARSQQWRVRKRIEGGSKPYNPPDEEDEVQSFWGQLWYVPKLKPSLPRSRVRVCEGDNLVWIKRDLWRDKSFKPTDCFPVGERDFWSQSPSKLRFQDLCWREEGKRTFAQVVRGGMAGRGRGRGPRLWAEEDWGRWDGGGWNQQQFPPTPPPQFYPLRNYGFFPNQLPPLPPAHQQTGFNRQFEGFRPRGGFQGRGRGRLQQNPRQNQNQFPNQAQATNGSVEETKPNPVEDIQTAAEKGMEGKAKDSNLHAVCFKCGQVGHLSSSCGRPKVCFICHSSEHLVDLCPAWKHQLKLLSTLVVLTRALVITTLM